MEESEVYAAVGEEGFRRLVAAFYRQVPHDEVLGPIYRSQDLSGAEKRLRDFLIFRFGGPPAYVEQRGHPRLRMRHAPFPVGETARDHWVKLMQSALAEANFPPEATEILQQYFVETANFLINR